MKTPTTRSGKGNGRGRVPPPPPPEDLETDVDELAQLPALELIQRGMQIIRVPGPHDERQQLAAVYQLLEALFQKLTSTADPALLTPIEKLNKDLKEAARTLGRNEARFLVDAYYKMQEDRIRSAHQVRTLAEASPDHTPEPHDVIQWLFDQESQLETQIKTALDYYSGSDIAGVWARSIKGIGPVISAGLLANIEIEKAPTVGHIWRFAGLDPTSKWLGTAKATEIVDSVIRELGEKPSGQLSEQVIDRVAERVYSRGEYLLYKLTDIETAKVNTSRANLIKVVAKRPWNAGLKRLCFLIGESFVKVSNRPDDIYGKLYKQRKEWETERNKQGLYADQAKQALIDKKFREETDAFQHYSKGHLPPARIHLRSTRRAVKIFLAHLHEVLYWARYEQLPPHPFVLDNIPGHAHRIEVPNLELLPDLLEAKRKAQPGGRKR
jgi:Transposase IS116/IS110/IS902 family